MYRIEIQQVLNGWHLNVTKSSGKTSKPKGMLEDLMGKMMEMENSASDQKLQDSINSDEFTGERIFKDEEYFNMIAFVRSIKE